MSLTSTSRDASLELRAVDPEWENEPVFQLPLEAKLRMQPKGPVVMPPRPGLTAQPRTTHRTPSSSPPDATRTPPTPPTPDRPPSSPPDILDELAKEFMRATPGLSYEEARRMADFA
jgi:hypothetical protein